MDFENSSIEKLKKTLYSRDENVVPKEKRTPVSREEIDVPVDWGKAPSFDIPFEKMNKPNNSFFNKFLLGSVVFFLLSLGAVSFIFFGGFNMISSNNVDIAITAPTSISSGEETTIGLSIINGNPTNMEEVALFINYPEGSKSAGVDGKTLSYEKVDLGNISKGQSKDYTISTVLFGEKDAIKSFTFRLEYKVNGSNAVFSKEKLFEVIIGSSPLILNVSFPQEINSGQELTLSIDVTSNASLVLKNTLVKVEYPYGFTYKSSNIKPLRNNSIWNIGDLKNGDKKTLTITGVLVGQDLEDRSFRIFSGTQISTTVQDFKTNLANYLVTVGIRKSFFDLSVIPASSDIGQIGNILPVSIKWQNTLSDKIINARIEAKITSTVLDKTKVFANNKGFYRSFDDTIFWDKNTTPNLGDISPGEEDQVSFTLSSLSATQIRSVKNPHIDITVTMKGDRTGLDEGPISSSAETTIKFNSDISFVSKSYRVVGPFVNNGPIPPKADRESTYTVTWTITNTTNDLKDAIASGVLPVGVEWKGEFSPSGERVSYNPDGRVITWNIGNIASGVGFTNSAKEVSFKVGLTPSLTQIGTIPILVSNTKVTANDTYTTTSLEKVSSPVTTQYSDSNFVTGRDIVVK